MSKITYSSSSPYATTPQTSWYIGRYNNRSVPAAADDAPYTLKTQHQYRPQMLSQELYGTPAYWWVFQVRNINLIRDPIWDFVAGTTIIVPSAAHLKKTLG